MEIGSVESVCIICRMDVVARVDVLTALLFYDFLYFLSCWLVAMADMALLKAIVSLYRAGEEKPIERYNTRVKVAEEIQDITRW